jgi:hypothetical protein
VIRGFPRAPSAGRPGDPGLFPSGSVAGRVNAETALLLGGEFRTYVSDMAATLVVSDEARDLVTEVVRPPVPLALAPGTALMRLITVGLLPPRLRVAYGYAWSTGRELTLDAVAVAARLAVPLLPDGIRRWPHAREADRRLQAISTSARGPARTADAGHALAAMPDATRTSSAARRSRLTLLLPTPRAGGPALPSPRRDSRPPHPSDDEREASQ